MAKLKRFRIAPAIYVSHLLIYQIDHGSRAIFLSKKLHKEK